MNMSYYISEYYPLLWNQIGNNINLQSLNMDSPYLILGHVGVTIEPSSIRPIRVWWTSLCCERSQDMARSVEDRGCLCACLPGSRAWLRCVRIHQILRWVSVRRTILGIGLSLVTTGKSFSGISMVSTWCTHCIETSVLLGQFKKLFHTLNIFTKTWKIVLTNKKRQIIN